MTISNTSALAACVPQTALGLCDWLDPSELKTLETKLMPSGESTVGFLNHGQSLREVVKLDADKLAKVGITHAQIADKLDSLMRRSIRLINEDPRKRLNYTGTICVLENKFSLVIEAAWRGLQSCPFEKYATTSCDNGKSCYDFKITNLSTSRSLLVAGLLPHLLGVHQFAEGPGCHYRLDPIEAAAVLEIVPGVNYNQDKAKPISLHPKDYIYSLPEPTFEFDEATAGTKASIEEDSGGVYAYGVLGQEFHYRHESTKSDFRSILDSPTIKGAGEAGAAFAEEESGGVYAHGILGEMDLYYESKMRSSSSNATTGGAGAGASYSGTESTKKATNNE